MELGRTEVEVGLGGVKGRSDLGKGFREKS